MHAGACKDGSGVGGLGKVEAGGKSGDLNAKECGDVSKAFELKGLLELIDDLVKKRGVVACEYHVVYIYEDVELGVISVVDHERGVGLT